MASQWLQSNSPYLTEVAELNDEVTSHDLPEFYDPKERSDFRDRLDSYDMRSIVQFFLSRRDQRKDMLGKLLMSWLARIVCVDLLAEIIYTMVQAEESRRIKEKKLLRHQSKDLLESMDSYLENLMKEYAE